MKTLKTTGKQSVIAIALLATTVFFNANAEDKKNENASTHSASMLNYKASNLNVGMYEFGYVNSLKLNINLTKDAGKTASVRLMDEAGVVLNQEIIGKKATGYNLRFDFSNVKTGKYFLEITSGDRVITKEIVKDKSTLSY